jgi:anti-sigma factor RsiW
VEKVMKCPDPETLFDYCEGSADRAVEVHLAGCAACRDRVDSHRAMWSALDRWEAPPVSTDFNRRLYARIESEDRRSRWWQQPLAAAAALVIVAGTAWMINQRQAQPVIEPETKAVVSEVENTLDDLEMLRTLAVEI